MTSEAAFIVDLPGALMDNLNRWSSEITILKARSIVEQAQRELMEAFAKQDEAKRKQRSRGRRR